MSMTLKLSELARLPKADRDVALGKLVEAARAPRNGQARELDQRIRAFEIRYEMTSEEMVRRLHAGQIEDTADISKWTMLLLARSRG